MTPTPSDRIRLVAKMALGQPIGSPEACAIRNLLRRQVGFGTIGKHWYVGPTIFARPDLVSAVYWYPGYSKQPETVI